MTDRRSRPGRCCRWLVLPLLVLLQACAYQLPKRPYVQVDGVAGCSSDAAESGRTTPERAAGYTLHFVEFDDQGWIYPDPDDSDGGTAARVGNPSRQLDCAIGDLRGRMLRGERIALYVFVHGWHHNANHDDRDVKRFRSILDDHAKRGDGRAVVGIFVGWDGQTVDVPVLEELTFLTRKNAAQRVADGRVRELFARIKGLRQHYNGTEGAAEACAGRKAGTADACPMRAVMIGHSFGGLILFSSVKPYLLETLAVGRDLPQEVQRKSLARAQGIADLVVLLNPAFEATQYEPLHRVAQRYVPVEGDQPLLISLTSHADIATRKYFPIARQATAIFQYPSATHLESEAVRDTIGNVDAYVTHILCVPGKSCELPENRDHGGIKPQPALICGDLELREKKTVVERPMVWNVRTFGDVIKDHNAILTKESRQFMDHVYGLATGTPNPCDGEKSGDDVKTAQQP